MGSRIEFHNLLCTIASTVYFQAPPAHKMVYPCVIYSRDNMVKTSADNTMYLVNNMYQVTYIDKNPDSDVPMKILKLQNSKFTTQFVKDGFYHNVFNIYY